MRKLLCWLERDFRRNWVFTDLVKCFVYQGREEKNGETGEDNMQNAIRYCSQYLDFQTHRLNPRIILVLGRRVARTYCSLRSGHLRQLSHGDRFSYERNGRHYEAIYSVFPSMRTSDVWVKDIDFLTGDAWSPVKQAFSDFFSKQIRGKV